MRKILIISVLCLFIDQALKKFLINVFSFGTSLKIIENFLNITLVKNEGAAFNILNENIFLLILIAIFVLIFIYFFIIKDKTLTKTDEILYGVLIGGILGNLLDRIFLGYVVDYIQVCLFNFPVFNFADMCIVISVIIIFLKSGDKSGK